MTADDSLPNDIEILKRLVHTREAELSQARAEASSAEALIAHLRLTIEKLKRDLFGPRNERKARLIDQMELQLEELEAAATEDEVAAEKAAAATTQVRVFTRRKPARQPFPAHLPRERIVIPGPTACACCGSIRLAKLGEDVTETLEVVPRQWKVVQHVREKFTCRDCEKISQAPAPFHVLPRGFAGPSLLAMILFEKYGQHQPLNRQSERYAREGVELSVSTLADQVGASAALLRPLYGPTYVMTNRSPGLLRRQRCSSIRAIAPPSILSVISPTMPGFCRPMPMPGSIGSTRPTAREGQSRRRAAGRTVVASSSSSPT